MTQLTVIPDIVNYIKGGSGEFTIVSIATGNHHTYRINKSTTNGTLFVRHLTGSDNTEDYSYLGIIDRDLYGLVPTPRSPSPSCTAFKALNWFLLSIYHKDTYNLSKVEFHHAGKCSVCSRKLTHPDSIKRGMGPKCRARIS